jgi:membrane-anchored protein YejM (alkaline phosphatase superfamily)
LLFYDSPHKYDFPPDWPLQFKPSLAEVDYMALSNATDPVPFHNRYLNSVRYVDQLAGKALDDVRARGLLEDTVLLVTGDHGQEFNDQHLNYWGHNSNFSRFQTQVPLLVRWPGEAPSVHDYPTSHFDVVPNTDEPGARVQQSPRPTTASAETSTTVRRVACSPSLRSTTMPPSSPASDT